MIFPIGDDQVIRGHKPIFTYLFLAMNIVIFFYEASLSEPALRDFIYTFGTIPAEILSGQDWFTLLTNMFLHGGWAHLIGNMLFLWVFADNIEAIVGNAKFVLFYIAGGIVASLVHIGFNMDSMIPAVGASGAIAAVLGAYIVMFPGSRIKLFVFPIFSFRVAAILFLGFWIVQQLMSGTASIVETADTAGVAWWAHIGGFFFGVIYGFFHRDMAKNRLAYR